MKRIFFIGVAIFLSGRLTAQSATAVYTQDDSVVVYRMLVQGKQLHGSNAEKAMQLVAEAATLAEKGHFTNAFIEANMLLGQWHFDHRSYLPALSSLEKAKAACLQTAADNHLGLVYKLIADVYARRSMFRQANDNYREASLVFRRTNQLKN